MDSTKSLDNYIVVATLLSDVQTLHSEVYTPRALRLDQRKLKSRYAREGIGLLTKTLPRLRKAFDSALLGKVSFDSAGWCKQPNSKLPKFMGGLFGRIFSHDGWVLPTPCVSCIAHIRHILSCFYKLKLPYEHETEQEVIGQFERTEDELLDLSQRLSFIAGNVDSNMPLSRQSFDWYDRGPVIRKARQLLAELFANFDWRDITPSHGPGAVSTRERYQDKWNWTRISPRLSTSFPLDSYFYASLGHVCDDYQGITALRSEESSARVVLVPKDSRGPRLISCEPLDFQWIQQGLSRSIVKLVESHPLTRWNINFTNQQPNQFGALLGSLTGRYSTLDLKEASDRISVGLVHLLFPEPLLEVLMNCRSLSTELPSGKVLNLNKYAPMGSALCFPVLALSVWAILTAGAPDADTRESILVYGDDVVVPTAYAVNAIEHLECFGLKVNRDKSCTSGFFRESCGVDAYKGVDVTPSYFRTVWSSSRCPHVYASYIAYANEMYRRKYFNTYWYIVDRLTAIYGDIPQRDTVQTDLSLYEVPAPRQPRIRRSNKGLHRPEYYVWDVRASSFSCEIDGWKMLLRFFTEGQRPPSHNKDDWRPQKQPTNQLEGTCITRPFAVRAYTKRKQVKLVRRWKPGIPHREMRLTESRAVMFEIPSDDVEYVLRSLATTKTLAS